MKNHIRILFSIFLVFALSVMLKINHDHQKNILKNKSLRFFDFTQDQVDSFQVNNFVSGILFKKQNGVWQLKRVKNELDVELEKKKQNPDVQLDTDFQEANSTEVAKALTYLCELRGLPEIATQPDIDKDKIFEINKYSLHVIFYDKVGKELDRVFIGKDGVDHYSSYIKKSGKSDIYLADQNFRVLFLRSFEEWVPQKLENKK